MSVSYTPSALMTMLLSRDNIGIISHYNPDPDAYGSSAALYLYLKQVGKKTWLINQDGGRKEFAWIPGVSETIDRWPDGIETLVICDCGDQKRIGEELLASLPSSVQLQINIDHHSSNNLFGDATYVRANASSTCELISEIICTHTSSTMSTQSATALLAGIYGDTGSFRHSNVQASTFELAGKLLRLGGDIGLVSKSLYSSFSIASVRLQSLALSQMKLSAQNKVAWIVITPEMIQESGGVIEDAEGLAEKGRDIEGVMVSAAARFDGEIWRISLRSKSDRCDVSEVAATFGGGGHKAAAAFRSRKSISEIEQALLPKLQSLVSQ